MPYIPLNAVASTSTAGATAQTIADGGATVPAMARYAEGYVRDASCVFYPDGSTPTATSGIQADQADVIYLRSRDEIVKALFIRQGAVSATINWTFYSSPGD